ncbi:MAG: heavy-metal-associated domain-containing protein [Candidatus Promineifilaceae bacterium]
MNTLSLDLPSMYGDHHVTEVRHLLLELSGVSEVYASSGFQVVEIQYDEAKLNPDEIRAVLGEAGYLGELQVMVEQGAVEDRENGDKPFFRQTVAYEQTGSSIGFAQQVPFSGRPLWPCPGMGPIKQIEEELNNG